jgi:uncharacterized protein (TIGR00661 family)
VINRCKHDKAILAGEKASFRFTRAFIKAKLPGCSHYVITSFFRPPVRKKRTTLVAPILRPEITSAQRQRGEHVLVYQTGEGYHALEQALARSGLECRIYGVRRELEGEVVDGRLRYRPFSEAGFIDDLASCRAVISGGGFTLMGEAVYLQKPMLSIPLKGQFEQILNARYLEAEGFGLCANTIDDTVVKRFIAELPRYEDRLADYAQDGNRELEKTLDGLLDRAEAGVLS